jgi:hypothetical protein
VIRSYPDADDIDRYSKQYGLAFGDIVRDICRIATIAYLCERGFLNERCVLAGGMGLRLRGSTRFTIFDSDSSMRGQLDEIELTGALTVLTDHLEVTPDDGTYWDRRTKLTIAKPINYTAHFAAVDPANPPEDQFAFTVSQRGLYLDPDWLLLTTPYQELVFDREVKVPVMHITEQAAEKAVGWTAASLAKHYVDLGWMGRNHAGEIETSTFQRMTDEKLKAGRDAHPSAYEGYLTYTDLLAPLLTPDEHMGPLNERQDTRKSKVRFMGEKMSWAEAKESVQKIITPLLFGPPAAAATPARRSAPRA